MPSTGDLLNHTLATTLNKISTLNTTVLPQLRSSTIMPINNNTSYPTSNASSTYNPYYPNYITIGPPVITYSYAYSYAYYVFILILLIAAIICIKIGLSRRKELEQRAAAQRTRALQQVQSVYVPSTSDNNNSNNNSTTITAAKEFDLPPTYEDVVQIYMINKQQQTSAENVPLGNSAGATANPSSNTISAAISTLTIETDITNSNNSIAVNVNNHSTTQ